MEKHKEARVYMTCPLCKVKGLNIKFLDLYDEEKQIDFTLAICTNCKAVYGISSKEGS